eukprot:1046066-Prymnesium_polylepis.2
MRAQASALEVDARQGISVVRRPRANAKPRSECGAQDTLNPRPHQEPLTSRGRVEAVVGGTPFDGALRLRRGRELTARQACVAVQFAVHGSGVGVERLPDQS